MLLRCTQNGVDFSHACSMPLRHIAKNGGATDRGYAGHEVNRCGGDYNNEPRGLSPVDLANLSAYTVRQYQNLCNTESPKI